MRTSCPRRTSALVRPATASPNPPVWANGVHSAVMKSRRLAAGVGSAAGGGVLFVLATGAFLDSFAGLATGVDKVILTAFFLGVAEAGALVASGGKVTAGGGCSLVPRSVAFCSDVLSLEEVLAEAGSRTSGAGAGGGTEPFLSGFLEEELLAMRKNTHFLPDRKGPAGESFLMLGRRWRQTPCIKDSGCPIVRGAKM